jgi:glucoamylase
MVAAGVLSDVYSPTVDNTYVETLRYVVTDGITLLTKQFDPRHGILHGS